MEIIKKSETNLFQLERRLETANRQLEIAINQLDRTRELVKLAEQRIIEFNTVDESDWSLHENFKYQIKATQKDFLKIIEDVPEFGIYRKSVPIIIYYFEDDVIFYVNRFEPNHRELLEQYLGINSISERGIDEEPIDEEPIDEEPIDEEPIDEEPI